MTPKTIPHKQRLEEILFLIERDGSLCCWFCKKKLPLNGVIVEHLNGKRNDNRLENKVLACQSCNIKKIDHPDLQILAKEKLAENEKKIFVRERKFVEDTEATKSDSEIEINQVSYVIVERFLSEKISTDGNVLFKEALNSCTFLCKKQTNHGSKQATRNHIDTLACEIGPFMVTKNENGKKIIVKRDGN